MIDMRLTIEARRAAGERSESATTLNHDIINVIAERGAVTDRDLIERVTGEPISILEHLELLSRLGFLTVVPGSGESRSYQLSKLGELAHSTSYFEIN